MIGYYLAGYFIHIIATYLIQRKILMISNNPEYHPVPFMMLLCFVPGIGFATSFAMLMLTYFDVMDGDYRTIYRIKDK